MFNHQLTVNEFVNNSNISNVLIGFLGLSVFFCLLFYWFNFPNSAKVVIFIGDNHEKFITLIANCKNCTQ